MTPSRAARCLAAGALLLVLSACIEPDGEASGAGFVGRTYLSTSVTEDGQPKPLVDGTTLTLTFTDGGISAGAGCNTMFGSGGIVEGVLVVESLAGTQMACDSALMEQEQWWGQFLVAEPAADVGDRALTLRTPTAVVAMVSAETVPDLPLDGTAWRLDTILSGETASSVPAGVASSLAVSGGSLTVAVDDCRATVIPVAVSSTTITFDADGFAASSCSGDAAIVDAAVMAVFAHDQVGYIIDVDRLTISGRDGAGLGYAGS